MKEKKATPKRIRTVTAWAITLGKTKQINAFGITQYGSLRQVLAIFVNKADAEWCAQSHNNVVPVKISGALLPKCLL